MVMVSISLSRVRGSVSSRALLGNYPDSPGSYRGVSHGSTGALFWEHGNGTNHVTGDSGDFAHVCNFFAIGVDPHQRSHVGSRN